MYLRAIRRTMAGAAASAVLAAGTLLGTAAPAQADWRTHCTDPVPSGYARLGSGQRLTAGQGITNGTETLIMQWDGNLVLRLSSAAHGNQFGPALWHTGTYGNPDAYAHMQPDGNLVVYRKDGTALWSTRTWNNSGGCAEITDRGDFNIAAQEDHGPLFYSSTGRCWCTVWNEPQTNV